MAEFISLTVRSKNFKNLSTSLTMAFDVDACDDVRANPDANLNGNTMFSFTAENGITSVYTVDESVATIVARGSATSVSGTTSESFSIDNDAATYVLLKNSTGTLQVRNQADTAYANLTAASGTFYLAAAGTVTIDAATTDHTGTSCMTFDVDINANPCNVINQTIDIATALSNDTVRGIYTDIDDVTASTNGSGLVAHEAIITGVSGSFSDIYGFKLTLDGTKDGGDEAIGLVVNGDALTINNAAEVLRGADIDFSSTTITNYVTNGFEGVKVTMPAAYHATSIASALSLAGAGSTLKALTGTTAGYTGLLLALGAGVSGITVDAATTDHTGDDNIFYADVDISDSAVVAYNALLDVTVAHTGANIVKGFNVDYDGIAANNDGSGFYGVNVTATATSTGREDIFGFYAVLDGTRDTDDLIKGFYIDGSSLTINSASAQLHGLVIDFDSVTDTDYLTNGFEGILVTMPATYQGTDVASAADFQGAGSTVKVLSGSSTIYGLDLTLGAASVGINIDAGTTDTTAANIIYANIDVNSANCNFIGADIDVGTALSAGEVVNGVSIDIDGDGADNATSQLNGFFTTNGGTSTGITTALRVEGTWDTCVNLNGATATTDIILSNAGTIHNTSADIMTFTEAGFNFVGNMTINGAGPNYFAGGGAADVITGTVTPALTSYVTGAMYIMVGAAADNTGACTLNINGLGAKNIKTVKGNDPAAADIETGSGVAIFVYDGTNMVLINPATTCD